MKYLNINEFELFEKILSPKPKRTAAILDALKEFRKFIQSKRGKYNSDQKIMEEINPFISVRVKNVEFKYHKSDVSDDRNWSDNYLLSAFQDNLLTRIIFSKGFWKVFLEFKEGRFGEFLFFISKFLNHEHIHLSQNQQVLKKVKNWTGIGIIDDDTKTYLSSPHEIMAWAYDAAIELKQQFGIKKSFGVIKDPMKYDDDLGDFSPFNVYRNVFDKEDLIYKKFIKYVVAYLERFNI
jgi:hypothetical protein